MEIQALLSKWQSSGNSNSDNDQLQGELRTVRNYLVQLLVHLPCNSSPDKQQTQHSKPFTISRRRATVTEDIVKLPATAQWAEPEPKAGICRDRRCWLLWPGAFHAPHFHPCSGFDQIAGSCCWKLRAAVCDLSERHCLSPQGPC